MRTPTICRRSEVAGAGTHTTEMSASVDEGRLEVGRLTVSNGTAELGFGARAHLRETGSVKWRLRSSAFELPEACSAWNRCWTSCPLRVNGTNGE
jgi:hypothetical protein